MRGTDDTNNHPQPAWLEDADMAERCCAFIDSTTDIFTHIRPDGEMTYVTSTEEMLGRSQQEFLETSLVEFIHPEDKERGIERFESALAGEVTPPVELRFRHGDGHWIWIESTTSQISPEYDLDGVVTATREITDRKRREQELEETKAELEQSNETLRRQNSRLDQFASMVSHDLRNPLSIAAASLELYRDTGNDTHLEKIEASIQRIDELTEDLLTLARMNITEPEDDPIAIHEVSRAVWRMIDTRSATLVAEEGTVIGDGGQLKALFENLFRNAVGHGGADVTVRVGPLDDGFYVEDTGDGIPPEERKRVFEHGFSTGYGGSGIGLTIVGRIAQAHDWEVSLAESEEGGARFEFSETDDGF